MNNWRDKIKPGLMYRLGTVDTGYQGAIDFGIAMEKLQLSDEKIQNSIEVFFNQEWVPLSDLSVERQGSIPGKIPTTEEMFEANPIIPPGINRLAVQAFMVTFAKLHVTAALKAAHSQHQQDPEDLEFTMSAYPLTNIK